MKLFQTIAALALAVALTTTTCAAQESRYSAFRAHNADMMAVQPSWMGPLIQSDSRLSQSVRISVANFNQPGAQVLSYGNNHGVTLITERRLQFEFDPPAFFRNHSAALKDGFGNAAVQVKYRIASGNAEHGNYAVTAILAHDFAPRAYQNDLLSSVYGPRIAAGKAFGRFNVQTTLGGFLPTAKVTEQGRAIEWNLTGQVHPNDKLWLDVENNAAFIKGSSFDGKTQNFMTPAAFYMLKRRDWGPTHSVAVLGAGMQIATSSFHFYNHNLITEVRVLF